MLVKAQNMQISLKISRRLEMQLVEGPHNIDPGPLCI